MFSDESSSDEDVDLENMTEEEKKKYFAEKTKRKEEREKRRREKYGDKYDDMVKENEKLVFLQLYQLVSCTRRVVSLLFGGWHY